MKKLILAGALLAPLALFAQEKEAVKEYPFTIEGTYAKAATPTTFYIRYRNSGKNVIDSAKTDASGKFTFKGEVAEPTMANFLVWKDQSEIENFNFEGNYKGVSQFFIDKGQTKINVGDITKEPTITGTPAQQELLKLNEMTADVQKQIAELTQEYYKARSEKNTQKMEELGNQYDKLDAQQVEIYKQYLAKNPKSPIGIYAISTAVGYDIDPAVAEPLYNNLADAVKASPSGVAFGKKLEIAKKTAVGQPAIQFSQSDKDGNAVSLASFKGKYVLVDFWASWCGPCRQENPNVVKAFNTYKDKGFTVFGISLDENKDKWLAAVEKDGLAWTQVSDLKGWKNEVAGLYGVNAIPQNFLIDPSGKIIGKNLRGEALEKKLAEVLN